MPDSFCIILMMSKTKKKKLRVIYIVSACLLLLIIYLAGLLRYSSRFLPNTTINNVNVSKLDVEEANSLLSKLSPEITIIEKDINSNEISETLELNKLSGDISYDVSELLRKQNNILWFITRFTDKEYICSKINGTYDSNNLDSFIGGLYCLDEKNIVMPENNSLYIDGDTVKVKQSSDGLYISKDKVMESIRNNLDGMLKGESESTVDLRDYYEKAVDDENIESKIADLQKVLDKTIYVNIDAYDEDTIRDNDLSKLLKIDNNEMVIDEDGLGSYIYELSNEYDSYTEYIDKNSLKKSLENVLLSKENETVDVNWIIEEINKRVEVYISEQMLYYYENDSLVLSSPIVSGNGNITDATPTGHYMVQRKVEDTSLMGRDYLEHVDYWIGFDETGRIYGLHDAQWRDEFGGDIWLSDPSRGCVNMPLDKVRQLYSYVDYDTEVVIYN